MLSHSISPWSLIALIASSSTIIGAAEVVRTITHVSVISSRDGADFVTASGADGATVADTTTTNGPIPTVASNTYDSSSVSFESGTSAASGTSGAIGAIGRLGGLAGDGGSSNSTVKDVSSTRVVSLVSRTSTAVGSSQTSSPSRTSDASGSSSRTGSSSSSSRAGAMDVKVGNGFPYLIAAGFGLIFV